MGDTLHPQSGCVAPPGARVRRSRLIPIVVVGLLIVAVLIVGGWTYFTFQANSARPFFGRWKYEKDKMVLTVEFRPGLFRDYMIYQWNRQGASGSGESTFRIRDAKNLELAGGMKISIDSVTDGKLVLSGEGEVFGIGLRDRSLPAGP